MKDILNKQNINITEDGKEYKYNLVVDDNGKPNYYPPEEKTKILNETLIDEILFLPITNEVFNNIKNTYHFGFKYIIKTVKHRTISIGPEILECGVSEAQLGVVIQRIRYEITGKESIVINKHYDPLHMPRIINIKDKTSEINTLVLKVTKDIIAEYNSFYEDKRV